MAGDKLQEHWDAILKAAGDGVIREESGTISLDQWILENGRCQAKLPVESAPGQVLGGFSLEVASVDPADVISGLDALRKKGLSELSVDAVLLRFLGE